MKFSVRHGACFLLAICLLCVFTLGASAKKQTSAASAASSNEQAIVIGSKDFSEQIILGELMAQTITNNTPYKVRRKFNLGGTNFTHTAITTGAIDIYPEYTGTGLISLLGEKAPTDLDTVFSRVKAAYESRYKVTWLKPFGFNNTYAVAVRDDDIRMTGVTSVEDLSRRIADKLPDFTLAINHEFMDRADGFQALKRTYGLQIRPKNVVNMQLGLIYTAIDDKQVDGIVAYGTDGRVKAFNLRLLEDNKAVFPPYEAAPIVRLDTLKKYPKLKPTLQLLAGKISNADMVEMNYQVDHLGNTPSDVATHFLAERGIIPASKNVQLSQQQGNFFAFAWKKQAYLMRMLYQHIILVSIALGCAVLIAVPTGILLTRYKPLETLVFSIVNLLQTVPSLALLGFLIPIIGIGIKPALLALFIYALLPLIRNTYIGINEVDKSLKEACRGMGLTNAQILQKVELPLAVPTIMAGIRTSTVLIVGTATLVALVGAGGLGDAIFRGISSVDTQMIMLGAVPAALLAIVLDQLLHLMESRLLKIRHSSPG